jgi:Methylase-associated X1
VQRAARTYARIYERVRRTSDHTFVEEAVQESGGRVLFTSGASAAPVFLGIEHPDGSRLGVVAYVFHANKVATRNRPIDEHRAQIRYGDVNDARWRDADHPVGFDPTGVDLTTILIAHPGSGLLIGLDPFAYDPLPLGNSIYFKDSFIAEALSTGWHVWERNTHESKRRGSTEPGLETVVGFKPGRLLDFFAVERRAQTLRLDHALRFRAAERAATERLGTELHELEAAYDLSARDLLDIIGERSRLAVAVRGGVAEHHLGRTLDNDPTVAAAEVGDQEAPPDYRVTLTNGLKVTVECKNASPRLYADGTPKVEVQKTRASRGDPASRYYSPKAFDVVAACMYGPTQRWTFKYRRSDRLVVHPEHPGRIAPLQRIESDWADTLGDALDRA